MNFKLIKRNKLKNCTAENTSMFSLSGQQKNAKVVNIVDGDTVDVVFKHNKKINKWRCRLYGIDTPETRTRDLEEKQKGLAAKEYTREQLENKMITLHCRNFDAFGRLLVDIFSKDECFNVKLLELGYANEYKK
jgi:micrococcal nuclease